MKFFIYFSIDDFCKHFDHCSTVCNSLSKPLMNRVYENMSIHIHIFFLYPDFLYAVIFALFVSKKHCECTYNIFLDMAYFCPYYPSNLRYYGHG